MRLSPLMLMFACSGGAEEEPSEQDTADDTSDSDSENADNVAPSAEDDAITTWAWRQTGIDVLSNDTDPNGDSLDIDEVSDTEHGFVKVYNDLILYTQTDEYIGTDTLTYVAGDGNGGTDSATVLIELVPPPTLLITSPTEGTIVEDDTLSISFEVIGCAVSAPSENPDGCHLHKYLDEAQYSDEDGTGFGHYDDESFTISPLTDGEHSFSLWLVANDGTDAAFNPLISDTVTVNVVVPDEGDPDSGR